MPPLKKPVSDYKIPVPDSEALIAAQTDVLVVGGGPAGLGASLGAARAGAKVVLAERYGFLGGASTVALVMPLMSAHTQEPTTQKLGNETLFPTDHGDGKRVIAGVLLELVNRLIENDGAIPPSVNTGYVVPFDPEIMKYTTLCMLDEAGVDILFHAFAFNCKNSESPEVFFHTKSGPVVIKAKVVVDCTGDGDIATFAGAKYIIGREPDGLTQPMTKYFRMVGFERPAFFEYIRKNPKQWYGVMGLWDLVEKAANDGKLELPRENILMFATPHYEEICVNSTRISNAVSTDAFDLTRAECESRYQVRQVSEFLKQYVPGFRNSYMAQSGTQIGIRESRRIIGDYVLTGMDVIEAKKFPDVIARCAYSLDIHNPQGKGTRIERLAPGEAYDIPLRCLLPLNLDKILVAGRCISGTHEAHSSYRIMPAAMATGQAAGVCAAIAALDSLNIHSVKPIIVQNELVRQNANLGDKFQK